MKFNTYEFMVAYRFLVNGRSQTVLIILGTLVIYTFDPCPAGAPADLLPSFCGAA